MSEMCSLDGETCRVPWAATPGMDLLSVQIIMNRRGMNQVPVVTEQFEDHGGNLVGLLDRECISLTRRLVSNHLISILIRITTQYRDLYYIKIFTQRTYNFPFS